mmetsp:Transcript_13790/g.54538  ORF Transcript_13790/g.54538 Transcript_13790/m.54538 type:complete len:219 (-) Transcript_13790:134-790(-)
MNERALSVVVLQRRVRAVGHEEADQLQVLAQHCIVQRRISVTRLRIDVGLGLYEELSNGPVSSVGSKVQRREAFLVCLADVCAALEQLLHAGQVTLGHEEEQRLLLRLLHRSVVGCLLRIHCCAAEHWACASGAHRASRTLRHCLRPSLLVLCPGPSRHLLHLLHVLRLRLLFTKAIAALPCVPFGLADKVPGPGLACVALSYCGALVEPVEGQLLLV